MNTSKYKNKSIIDQSPFDINNGKFKAGKSIDKKAQSSINLSNFKSVFDFIQEEMPSTNLNDEELKDVFKWYKKWLSQKTFSPK